MIHLALYQGPRSTIIDKPLDPGVPGSSTALLVVAGCRSFNRTADFSPLCPHTLLETLVLWGGGQRESLDSSQPYMVNSLTVSTMHAGLVLNLDEDIHLADRSLVIFGGSVPTGMWVYHDEV